MQKESPERFSLGQRLKAESFYQTVEKAWLDIHPLVPKLTVGAMQSESKTSVDQDRVEGENFVSSSTFAIPKAYELTPASRLRAKQSWEGTVLSCDASGFTARVKDRTNPTNADEVVVFGLDEISPDDQPLVATGASFYWTVGTEKTPAGQIKNVAFINFRRSPRWKRSSFRHASERAKRVLTLFSEK